MKSKFKKFLDTEYFYLLIILAVSFAIMLPVLLKGIPFGYDLPHHYQCAMTFAESIKTEDFYPSWSLNRNFGFGGMESRLYPPISHYSLALGYLLTGDWHLASWLIFTIFTFLGGLGVYLWAKEYMPSSQAVFAGVIFILLPYHLNQLYNTFFFAEYVGTSLLPFTFYFVSRVCRRGNLSNILGLAISYSILILTHLPLTVIGSICFAIYGLTLIKRESFISQLTKLGIGVLLGLASSSFFWTKVILEKDLMAKTLIYKDPWLDYRLHFLLTPFQTFEGELRERIFETATMWYDLMSLCAIALVLCCTVSFLIWEKKSKFTMKGVWVIFVVSVFLTLPFSRFVWDIFPPLQEVQFPWRWVAIICIVASVISASQLNFLLEWFQNKKRPFALIICGGVLAVITFSLSQIVRQAPYIEKGEVFSYMEKNSKDIGFTFWWTIWTKEEAFENKEKVSVENRNVTILNWTSTNREFQISEGDSTEARITTFYHPNWKAEVNGKKVTVEKADDGTILIPINEEKSKVSLYFDEPYFVKAAKTVSLVSWGFLIFFGISLLIKNFLNPSKLSLNEI